MENGPVRWWGGNNVLQALKNRVFQEPRGGRWHWIELAIGCCVLVGALLIPIQKEAWLQGLLLGILGLYLILQSAPEVLPKDRATLAGTLRMGRIVCTLAIVVLVLSNIVQRTF